ncbi:hypothetical protein GHT06_003761 [Daphnia sinensis]|uniref:Uncharacterized protein n=1 Tax=Daphnia sinensis TaxID=1820382 RepID=A0AAD5KU43_9CRUS|nr:hypothetical protein GHT06_003761 [Daphnia sinensis]
MQSATEKGPLVKLCSKLFKDHVRTKINSAALVFNIGNPKRPTWDEHYTFAELGYFQGLSDNIETTLTKLGWHDHKNKADKCRIQGCKTRAIDAQYFENVVTRALQLAFYTIGTMIPYIKKGHVYVVPEPKNTPPIRVHMREKTNIGDKDNHEYKTIEVTTRSLGRRERRPPHVAQREEDPNRPDPTAPIPTAP